MKSILFVTAIAVAFAAAQSTRQQQRFVISDFGAVADAATVNTKAIQSAIDKCTASGGGVVIVPKGTFAGNVDDPDISNDVDLSGLQLDVKDGDAVTKTDFQ